MTTQAELPKYQSHKTVWALKIQQIAKRADDILIYPESTRFAPFTMPIEWAQKHNPEAGGYYVVYNDGYKSYSPAEAFESGYSEITQVTGVNSDMNEQIKCVEREIAMRKRVYPRWVSGGKMTQAKADDEIRAMESVLATLKEVLSNMEFELK